MNDIENGMNFADAERESFKTRIQEFKPSLISSKTKNSIWRSTSGASTYVFLESKK